MSKGTILEKIQNSCIPAPGAVTAVPIREYIRNEGDLLDNFIENIKANKAEVHECARSDVQDLIIDIVRRTGCKKLFYPQGLFFDISSVADVEGLEFNRSVNEIAEKLFACDASILQARLGVSNLGLLCVTSSAYTPRLLSLLPTHCIMLLEKSAIVESLNDAFVEIKKEKSLPSNILFIIGPSRTSDIELQVVLGVHGPQNVHVILYETDC
ncbi:MAG: lactate utilization protein C [Desulfobulbus propionicus]|nr:MAG: lactate utilization protein C [Desulfobulbus propionicus]